MIQLPSPANEGLQSTGYENWQLNLNAAWNLLNRPIHTQHGIMLQLDDERFEALKDQIPWGSVCLAVSLMMFGLCSFVVAWLHITQEILGKEQAVRGSLFA